jgi:hypothetical protein
MADQKEVKSYHDSVEEKQTTMNSPTEQSSQNHGQPGDKYDAPNNSGEDRARGTRIWSLH